VCPGDSPPADSTRVPFVSFVVGTTSSPPCAAHTTLKPGARVLTALHDGILPPAEPPPVLLPCIANDPPGLVIHHLLQDQDRSNSPTTPFDFPFSLRFDAIEQSSLAELPPVPSVSDSIVQVVGYPHVLGLQQDSQSSVKIRPSDTPSGLVDGGANICATGNLSILVGVVDIPPLPITVALKDSNTSIDDCCTKRGFLPLSMSDGSIHWQVTFFCANMVETIILPQAILASSDVFVSWTMTGYKDGRPGSLQFDSHDGFLHVHLSLVCHDGLYYCPTDVFTLDHSPIRVNSAWAPTDATVLCVTNNRPQSVLRWPSCYEPTTKAHQLESEVWLL
jgi:hypothetical protein